MLKSWKIIAGLLRDNINIFWELRCLLNLSCAASTHGEEAGWMYWEAGEFVRKWCYTLLSAGEESCILSECQQCIVHTMKRRWGNYFLARHKTSIRSLASSTHTQQYTLQSVTQILYIVMYERRSEDPWLSGDLIWVPRPLAWTSIPRKMTHFITYQSF